MLYSGRETKILVPKTNPEFIAAVVKENTGWSRLKSVYGISKEQYMALLEAQNYKCKICGLTSSSQAAKVGRKKVPSALAVDHCHQTGRIRGLLCVNCNSMLGMARDNPTLLLRAIQYLKGNL